MNPLKSPLKRTAAVLAGAVIGLTGALALAAPASADHTTITGVTACTASGDWTVTWTVVNSEARKVATIKQIFIQPFDTTVEGIAVGGEIPAGGQIIGTENISKTHYNAELSILATWLTKANGQPDPTPPTSSNHGYAFRPETCPSTPPTPTPTTTPTTAPSATAAPASVPAPVSPTPMVPVGNELPKTGVAIGAIASGAALLLAVGAGLFVLARRRKLKFTV